MLLHCKRYEDDETRSHEVFSFVAVHGAFKLEKLDSNIFLHKNPSFHMESKMQNKKYKYKVSNTADDATIGYI